MMSNDVSLMSHGLLSMARSRPDQLALVGDGRRLSYAQVLDEARQLARTLSQLGVQAGDRVMVYMDNSVAMCVGIWAILLAGGVLVPVHPSTKPQRLRYLLADAEPKGVLTQGHVWPGLSSALASCPPRFVLVHEPRGPLTSTELTPVYSWVDGLAPDVDQPPHLAGGQAGSRPATDVIDQDLAALIYTSGSTGEPKGVMLTHLNMRSACAAILAYLPLRADDRILCALPMCFSYGLYHLFLAALSGAALYVEKGFAFPVKMVELMRQERISVLPAVPTMYAMLLGLQSAPQGDWSALRIFTNAGSALPMEHVRLLAQHWPQARLYNMYGLTECARASYLDPDEVLARPGSVGRGMPHQQCWLVDDHGVRLPPGATGELVVRGSHVMRGYWKKPEETAEKLRPGPIAGEVVLHTGDLFRMDEQGYLHFVARCDDIIKSRGEKVSPREVEEVIHQMDGVAQVAVVGVPDAKLGHAIHAFVVLRQAASVSERDVIRHCQANLESFKAPQSVVFLEALPHTDSGKVLKRQLVSTHSQSIVSSLTSTS